jgi:hypothetical protein
MGTPRPAGVDEPALGVVAGDLLGQEAPVGLGPARQEGGPKQGEKVGVGEVTPRSVPATLAVKPDRKWYMACAGDSRAMGGRTPKASQVSMTTWRGWPAMPVPLALGMASSG